MQWIRKNLTHLRDRSCHELSIWLKMGYGQALGWWVPAPAARAGRSFVGGARGGVFANDRQPGSCDWVNPSKVLSKSLGMYWEHQSQIYIYIFISVYPVECDNTKTNVGQYVPLNNRQQACRTRPLPSIQSTCNMQIGMCISRIISMVLAETQLHVLNISSYTGYLLVINPLRSGSHTYNLLEYPWKSGV